MKKFKYPMMPAWRRLIVDAGEALIDFGYRLKDLGFGIKRIEE